MLLIRVGFYGSSKVGKTSIITQFMFNTFNEKEAATVGVDFFSKIVQCDGKEIHLQIWDASGDEQYYHLVKKYQRSSIACVLVYDPTNRESFDKLEQLINDINAANNTNPRIFIVASKSDLKDNAIVSYDEGKHFADQKGFLFMSVCAKNSTSIEEMFMSVVESIAATM